MAESVDTVIVGAGLAGLTAADRLSQAGQRARVLVAANGVGGRTCTRFLAGDVLTELGGEWVGPQHRHVLRLAKTLGVHTRKARQLGHPALWRGVRRSAVGRLPVVPCQELRTLAGACWRLDRIARRVDPVNPWLSADADDLDGRIVAAWLRAHGVHGDAYRYFSVLLGALLSADVERVSLPHVLWWLARGRGLVRTVHATFAYSFAEGAQELSLRLARRLGDQVTLASPVHRVAENSRVDVDTQDGDTVSARHAVVTTHVGCLSRIEFAPALPAPLTGFDELRGHRDQGHRDVAGGLSGPPRCRRRPPPRRRVARRPPCHRVHRAKRRGCRCGRTRRAVRLPSTWAGLVHRAPLGDRPWIPSCDIGFAPGQLRRYGLHLSRSHGNVHFAGAERSSWPNSMEGAAESGTRAARQILGASSLG